MLLDRTGRNLLVRAVRGGAPGRVGRTLADLAAACGPDRPVAVARELTKVHEEVWRGTVADAAAWAADGVRTGYLPQEPALDPAKDVRGNVMEGVAKKKALVDRFNEIAANYSDETADEMAKLQDEIDALA